MKMDYDGVYVSESLPDEAWCAMVELFGDRRDAPDGMNTLEAQLEFQREDTYYCIVLRCYE